MFLSCVLNVLNASFVSYVPNVMWCHVSYMSNVISVFFCHLFPMCYTYSLCPMLCTCFLCHMCQMWCTCYLCHMCSMCCTFPICHKCSKLFACFLYQMCLMCHTCPLCHMCPTWCAYFLCHVALRENQLFLTYEGVNETWNDGPNIKGLKHFHKSHSYFIFWLHQNDGGKCVIDLHDPISLESWHPSLWR